MPAPPPTWLDDAFKAFAHPLRRDVLRLLHDREDPSTDVDELCEELAASFEDATEGDVRMALHHRHLPTLRSVGFVEYDRGTGEIRYRPNAFVEHIIRSGAIESVESEHSDDGAFSGMDPVARE